MRVHQQVLTKLVTKLNKTLQDPSQASLELDNGWLRLDALSGAQP
jgi:hypothetical protein